MYQWKQYTVVWHRMEKAHHRWRWTYDSESCGSRLFQLWANIYSNEKLFIVYFFIHKWQCATTMKTKCRGNLPLLVGATSWFLSIPFVHSNVLDGIERKGKSSMYHLCVCLTKRTRLLHQPKRTHMIYGVSHPYDCNRHSLIQTIKANQTVELLVLLASELFQAINRFLSSFVESQRYSKEFFSFFEIIHRIISEFLLIKFLSNSKYSNHSKWRIGNIHSMNGLYSF